VAGRRQAIFHAVLKARTTRGEYSVFRDKNKTHTHTHKSNVKVRTKTFHFFFTRWISVLSRVKVRCMAYSIYIYIYVYHEIKNTVWNCVTLFDKKFLKINLTRKYSEILKFCFQTQPCYGVTSNPTRRCKASSLNLLSFYNRRKFDKFNQSLFFHSSHAKPILSVTYMIMIC